MSDPFWSVIVPVKGVGPFLRETISSVVGDDREILVQDNSPADDDAVYQWLLSEGHLPFVGYEHNGRDLGCCGSVNAALQRARGAWVHVCHSDDFVRPNFYATFRAGLAPARPAVGLAACRCYVRDELDPCFSDVNGIETRRPILEIDLSKQLQVFNPFHVVQVVIRRDVFAKVGPFREDLALADWEFYRRASGHVSWHCRPEVMAVYRRHAGQGTHALEAGRLEREARLLRGLTYA